MGNYCPKCGNQFAAGDRFCGTCGTTIAGADAAPAPSAPAASDVQPPAARGGASPLIPMEEFDNERLMQIYESAFMAPTLNPTGQIQLVVNGVIVMARATPSPQPFFIIAAMLGFKPDANRLQKLEFCNRVNDKMVMARSCVPDVNAGVVWVDHWTTTEGGISAPEIVGATRRFVTVVIDGCRLQDTDHILK